MELIQPNDEVLIQLPSETTKLVKIVPDSIIGLGKFGSFPANSLLGRPYYLTWNILDGENFGLEPVPISELNSEKLATHVAPTSSDPSKSSKKNKATTDSSTTPSGIDSPGFALEDTAIGVQVGDDGEDDDEDVALDAGMLQQELEREQKLWEAEMKNNREIRDDQTAQTMTWQEIEKLKKSGGTGSGKEIIARLLQSHASIDKKTAFSLAKYTKRKTNKYLKRIRVIPADIPNFTNYHITQKEPLKILEIRDEALGLLLSWADVRWGGRYLVIDDTGGLVVAAVAERMGLLAGEEARAPKKVINARKRKREDTDEGKDEKEDPTVPSSEPAEAPEPILETTAAPKESNDHPYNTPIKPKTGYEQTSIPVSNTITVLHTQDQPNLSLLRPYNFDTTNLINATTHPLSSHLLSLSFLQLLSPEADVTLERPTLIPDPVLRTLKSVKRTNYHRKCRRQERLLNIVASTRRGGFDGAIIATGMELSGVINTVTPLLKGSGQLVIYSPSVEPLSEVADWCSTLRRTEFMRLKKVNEGQSENAQRAPQLHIMDPDNTNPDIDPETLATLKGLPKLPAHNSDEYFPIDPTTLLAPTIHTSRVRTFQALPGRTHPLMTSRGGSEGYVLHATKVFPILEGKVEARGKFGGRRKGGGGERSGGAGGKKEGEGRSASLNGKKEVDVMEVDPESIA